MKTQLFIKLFGGSKRGLLHVSREEPSGNVEQTVAKILKALKGAGVAASRDQLKLKLRRFSQSSPFADGIFVAPGGVGYFLWAPATMASEEVEGFMMHCLNIVPFFLAHESGDTSKLLTESELPKFPELPAPITTIWSAGEISTGSNYLQPACSHE